MYNLNWSSPCELQDILFLKRNPFMSGLGYYEDIDGITWDIHGVIGGSSKIPYVQARRITDAPSYYGTASWDTQAGSHSWKPYIVDLSHSIN